MKELHSLERKIRYLKKYNKDIKSDFFKSLLPIRYGESILIHGQQCKILEVNEALIQRLRSEAKVINVKIEGCRRMIYASRTKNEYGKPFHPTLGKPFPGKTKQTYLQPRSTRP